MNKQKNYKLLDYQRRKSQVIKASHSFWSFISTNNNLFLDSSPQNAKIVICPLFISVLVNLVTKL